MKRALCLMLLSLTVLTGCGSAAAEPMPTAAASPWGEVQHAGAAPYVRTQEQSDAAPMNELDRASFVELVRGMRVEKGSFYIKDWELEMFDALPQDDPYSFVPHPERFILDHDLYGESDYIALAEQFAEAGCEAKVKMLHNIEDGYENIAYLVVVTTTPAHLWELSEDWPEPVYVEQLYPEVDLRFDIPVWPGE